MIAPALLVLLTLHNPVLSDSNYYNADNRYQGKVFSNGFILSREGIYIRTNQLFYFSVYA